MPPKKAPKTQSAQLSGAESLTTPALFIVLGVPPIFLFFLRPPLDVRQFAARPKINLIANSIESRFEPRKRGVYLTRWPLDAHSRTGTEITIAFLTEKDRQMAEKRRKKWRPFCLAHLRRPARWVAMYTIFFQKKTNQNKCTWSGVMTGALKNSGSRYEMTLLARIFFHAPFSFGKSYAVALFVTNHALGSHDFWLIINWGHWNKTGRANNTAKLLL